MYASLFSKIYPNVELFYFAPDLQLFCHICFRYTDSYSIRSDEG